MKKIPPSKHLEEKLASEEPKEPLNTLTTKQFKVGSKEESSKMNL